MEQLFDELDRRASQSHLGRRPYFRRLTIPDQVRIEFEQIISQPGRGRGKPKVGRPLIRRQPGRFEYHYVFKKVERPMRFRVVAGATVTPWFTIDVRPLPTLRSVVRYQNEPGYLHESNERYEVGPLPVSVEGTESSFEVPAGSRLRLVGQFYKRLASLRVTVPETSEQLHPAVSSLAHERGSDRFEVRFKELTEASVSFALDYTDLDGISAQRVFHVRVIPDRPPEFKQARFVGVNRKMITQRAIIPFVGHVVDDHGLLGLWYEVALRHPQAELSRQVRYPFRRFAVLTVGDAMTEGGVFPSRSRVTLAKLFSGPRWELLAGGCLLARMPCTGPIGFHELSVFRTRREHAFAYEGRGESETTDQSGAFLGLRDKEEALLRHLRSVLGPQDEFFDTLLLQRSLGDESAEESSRGVPVPYRIVIRLAAQDNCIHTDEDGVPVPASQTGYATETFEFRVVSEADLLIEEGKREEEFRDRCEAIVASLRKGRMTILKRLRDDFDNETIQRSDYNFRRVSDDLDDLLKIVSDNQDSLDREVAQPFRAVYRELVLNRCRIEVLDRLNDKICRPLEAILEPGQHFDLARQGIIDLQRHLQQLQQQTPRQAVERAITNMDRLISRLEQILGEMKKLIEFNQALEILRDIINREKAILDAIKKKEAEEKKKELRGDLIG